MGLLFFALLAYVSRVDIKTRLIPDWVHLPLIAGGLIANGNILNSLLGGAAVSGVFLILALTLNRSGSGIGGGDIKLVASCGCFLGWPSILWAAILALAGFCVFYKLLFKAKKQAYAMAPFLSAGFALVYILKLLGVIF